jgi:hypothetical protein
MARVKKVKEVPHGLCPNCGQSKCECRVSEKIMAALHPDPFKDVPKETPRRVLCLLSWDKGIQAGMLHIQSDGKSAVYYVRRIDTLTPTFQFTKLQPGEEGITLRFPYTTHLIREGDTLKGVCHCDGYKHRKQCRHVDAAITMVEEYGV